jgi:hypothetical protein
MKSELIKIDKLDDSNIMHLIEKSNRMGLAKKRIENIVICNNSITGGKEITIYFEGTIVDNLREKIKEVNV